jgi:hypothetical protein
VITTNGEPDARGFVIHLVTRDGAHRGWWRREFPHVVELARADRFATAYEASGCSAALLALACGYRTEVWSPGLAQEQGVPEPAFAPGGMRP